MERREDVEPAGRPAKAGSSIGTVGVDQVTTWLIVINVLVYFVDSMVRVRGHDAFGRPYQDGLLTVLGNFSISAALSHLQLWRFITFQFLHANFMHLAMNMLGLYFFGPLIESYLGSKRFTAFYLICGVAGGLGFVLLWGLGQSSASASLVGASAGVFGVLLASATIAPDETVLVYGIIPMRLRALAWLLLLIAGYTVFTQGRNAGGEAAHLGGAVMGWLLIRNPRWLKLGR